MVETKSSDSCLAETHQVENQPAALEDYNPFRCDLALREAVHREGAGWAEDELTRFGELTGDRKSVV